MTLVKQRHSRQKGGLLRTMLTALREGDLATRLSFLLMGCGCLFHGQIGRGVLYLAAQILFLLYLIFFGAPHLMKFTTLGTETQHRVFDEEEGIYLITAGDNSMEILLFSVVTLVLIVVFLRLYASNIRAAWEAQSARCKGNPLPTFRDDLISLTDRRYHALLLTPPVILVFIFTVLPLVFMVLIAFTNFDKAHQPPGNLFTWVGLENFRNLFSGSGQTSTTFFRLFGWTVVWAIFATFLNYLLGMAVALMINKRGIRAKGLWRTLFVIPIAVPQFVTLLLMSQLLSSEGTGGAFNVLLQQLGLIQSPIPFLSDGTLAKITVIVVNIWIGIPYTILITSGILMNIPEDMYESARIDGAGPFRTFFSITLPYMLFVTTPYLITQFVGNFNNFNVIYLLTGGGPLSLDYFQAGKTDLLVTWLYKQTVDQQNYNLASTIGIIVFLVSAGLSLLVYNSSASARKEEQFQ
ncbi:MAG: sugar ABC transporter permease [Ruminococcaceae bacterium]|nr:sugar ABC transporter permease [Oscillospiraceae bacterium]